MSGSEWPTWLKANARRVNALSSAVSLIFFHSIPLDLSILKKKSDDYFNAGYGRIIMVPRVKLAYDRKVWDIIHPERRNLTAIRGYKRIGGLPDDPHSDPQDRSWYGPHDRLFTPEETEELEFVPGPEYGKSITVFFCPKSARKRKKKGWLLTQTVAVWCWGWDGAGDLDGPDVDPIWEHMQPRSYSEEAIQIKHYRNMPGW